MSGLNRARFGVRLRPDSNRIAQSVSTPGIDPRPWVQMARVDEGEDAAVWDTEIGWLVSVYFVGGEHDGEGPIVCRVASDIQGSGCGSYSPVREKSLVVVLVVNGDPNDDCVIVSQLHDIDDFKAPTEVNGDSIVETNASSGQVAADETHILVAPEEDCDQEWRNVRITADQMVLGAPQADESCVRGNDLADALSDFADAIDEFCNAIATATPAAPNAALTVADVLAAYTPFAIKVAQFKNASENYLSTRIKVD